MQLKFNDGTTITIQKATELVGGRRADDANRILARRWRRCLMKAV